MRRCRRKNWKGCWRNGKHDPERKYMAHRQELPVKGRRRDEQGDIDGAPDAGSVSQVLPGSRTDGNCKVYAGGRPEGAQRQQ